MFMILLLILLVLLGLIIGRPHPILPLFIILLLINCNYLEGTDNIYEVTPVANSTWTQTLTGSWANDMNGADPFYNGVSGKVGVIHGYGWYENRNWLLKKTMVHGCNKFQILILNHIKEEPIIFTQILIFQSYI